MFAPLQKKRAAQVDFPRLPDWQRALSKTGGTFMRIRFLLAATALASVLAPTLALAQAANVGEVIVTARKRQETILNVPVVETALPRQQLERFQVQDLKDVATKVPGLTMSDAVLTIGSQIALRGIGTNTLDAGVDQSIALNLDGLQLTNGLAYSAGMFDVGQVEVLKGPQALFYGKNSPGGVISIRTADPTDAFEVIGRVGREIVAKENRAEVIVSGPVNDQLRLRLAALWDRSDGYFNMTGVSMPILGGLAPAHATGPLDTNYMIRGTALWRPTNDFDARLKINFTHDREEEAGHQQVGSCPDGTGPVPGFGVPFLANNDCTLNRNVENLDADPAAFPGIRNGGVPFLDTNQRFGTLELNYHPRSDVTVTSTTGYYHVLTDGLLDTPPASGSGPSLGADNHFTRRDVTQELRVNSDFAGPLNFTAGGYFQDAEVKNLITLLGNTTIGLPGLLVQGSHDLKIRAYSGFGQVRWKVVPQVEVALGARWSHETRSDTAYILSLPQPFLVPLATPEIKSDNLSPELTITYKPADNITAFGSLKKGYKSGSYNITVVASPGEDNSFGDEKVQGGEVGLKTRWLDRRLAANLALYNYRYEGLQVGTAEPPINGIPITKTVNAGGALVYGVDFDTAYRPEFIDGLEGHAAVEWNHARFKTLDNVPCWGGQTIAEGCTQVLNDATGLFTAQNLNGAPLVRAPQWQTTFGFSYETPIGNDLTLVFASDTQYSSKYLTTLGTRADFYQPSFFKTDVNITLRGPRDRWEFSLIGKNLNDALTSQHCDPFNVANGIFPGQITGGTARGPAGIDETQCFVDRGREVWLRLTLKPFS
jgi:iron complex outermembrane receptor protein